MSNHAFTYEDPFRPIYEYHQTAAWSVTGVVAAIAPLTTTYPTPLLGGFAVFCAMMAVFRAVMAIRISRRQAALNGRKLSFMTRDELHAKCQQRAKQGLPPAMFIGYGFPWTQEHAQLVHQITRQDQSRLLPFTEEQMGQTFLHGLGMEQEDEVWIPLDHLNGHLLIVGATRSGKSRTLDSIIAQAVDRHEPLIVFDPKGDFDLRESMLKACQRNGRPQDFLYLHPAFPERSIRLDPLATWSRPTELATRIASLIPSESGSDPFTAHSQMILSNLCEGLLMINRKPTIKLLYSYVASGPESLVMAACEAYFGKHIPDWRDTAEPYLRRTKSKAAREITIAYIAYYREHVQQRKPSLVIEGLFHDFEHDRQHQAKMTASLLPVLKALTSGSVGDLLSPDPLADDPRRITDFATIIRNRQVCYVGLDSLSDPIIGSCLGSIFISDLAAYAGSRYNYEDVQQVSAVNLIVDELAELIGNERLLQIANKGGGAKLRAVFATQTLADLSAKLGSDARARQVLGNINNVISLRCMDGETQEYLTEAMPKTFVRHLEFAQSTDTSTNDLVDFKYRVSESLKETEVPLVQPPHFGCLPNLESWARVSGGKVWKVRQSILVDEMPR